MFLVLYRAARDEHPFRRSRRLYHRQHRSQSRTNSVNYWLPKVTTGKICAFAIFQLLKNTSRAVVSDIVGIVTARRRLRDCLPPAHESCAPANWFRVRCVALYRVYFRNQYKFVVGRDDFAAEDDARAMAIARALCDACSDLCTSFELWQGVRQVEMGSSPRSPDMNFDEIAPRVEDIVLERELVLRESRWVIAESQRLLQQTQHLLNNGRRRAP
jgi:hypothetical protein